MVRSLSVSGGVPQAFPWGKVAFAKQMTDEEKALSMHATCEDDAAVVSNHPPNLKAAACRFGALCTVTATPGQRYPPRLVSSSN